MIIHVGKCHIRFLLYDHHVNFKLPTGNVKRIFMKTYIRDDNRLQNFKSVDRNSFQPINSYSYKKHRFFLYTCIIIFK